MTPDGTHNQPLGSIPTHFEPKYRVKLVVSHGMWAIILIILIIKEA